MRQIWDLDERAEFLLKEERRIIRLEIGVEKTAGELRSGRLETRTFRN